MKKENLLRFASYFFMSTVFVFLFVVNSIAQSETVKPTPVPTIPSVMPPDIPEGPQPKASPPIGDPILIKGGGTSKDGVVLAFNPPIKKGPFKWEELVTENKFLSISMPSNFSIVSDKEEFTLDALGKIKVTEWTTTGGHLNDAVYMFEIYKTKQSKEAIYELARDHFGTAFGQTSCNEIKLNDVKGVQCVRRTQVSYMKAQYFFDNERAFAAMSSSKDENNPILQQFFSSLRIKANTPQPINTELKEDMPLDEEKTYKSSDVTQKARLVWNPKPVYTEEARKNQVEGYLRIAAILSADGHVRNVRAISNLPYGLTKHAISSAKRIRFFPAIKDGKRVSQHVTLEYNFRIY